MEHKTAYGVFVQACWAQHKRLLPDDQIRQEIENFNKQCSVWWYNLSDAERDKFQEMADNNNRLREQQNAAAAEGNRPNNVTEEDFKVSSNAWGSMQPNRDGEDMTST